MTARALGMTAWALGMTAWALGMTVLTACSASRPAPPPPLTYDTEIAPIIETRCQPCHRPNGPGPMPLTSYDEVMRHIVQVRGNVVDKVMPPERIDAAGEKHPAGLSDAEIATIVRWMQAGYRQR